MTYYDKIQTLYVEMKKDMSLGVVLDWDGCSGSLKIEHFTGTLYTAVNLSKKNILLKLDGLGLILKDINFDKPFYLECDLEYKMDCITRRNNVTGNYQLRNYPSKLI